MNQFEIIKFSLFGLKLQEPMALITNWMISACCFFVYLNIKWSNSYPSICFKKFYIVFGLSTFLSGFGHIFFYYTGFYGKYPAWILGVTAGIFISQGILFYWKDEKFYNFLRLFLIIKSLSLICLSIITQKFIFVAVDTIVTYLLYCGFIAGKLWLKKMAEMKYFVYGIIVLIPSAFIFLMNINLHLYLNRDDLSHLLMIACILFFYVGIKKINLKYPKFPPLRED